MDFDVIIIGSGIVGLAFALALKAAGLRLALVAAQSPQPPLAGWENRVYAISPGSAAFLENCGVWQHLEPGRVTRIEDMRIFGDDTASELDFSAYEAGLRELAIIVEHTRLQYGLWNALGQETDIARFAPAVCSTLSVASESAELQLHDGRTLRSQLVVAADGADSWTRSQAGIEVRASSYRQSAVVANFSTAKPHAGTAFQWFRRDGVLALLPLPENRTSIVWSTSESNAQALLALSAADLALAVAAASRNALGELEFITPPAAFALRLQRVRQLVRPRLALIGDAAHNVHPLAGQGLNLGLRDAKELAQTLMQRGAHIDCGDYHLLRRYERARREDILATQVITDALHKLFGNEGKWLAPVRNLGLRLTNRQPHLKNLLVQHAVG